MSVSIETVYAHSAPKGPVYTTFWTQHGTYPEHGEAWLEQMKALGVPYRAALIETEDLTWCGRCRVKAWWLTLCLLTMPGREVIWLDVDSVVEDLPPWPEWADMGLVEQPVKWQRNGRFMAGVLFLRNTETTRRVVDRWAYLCETEPEDYSCDMNLLERAVHGERDLNLECLSPTYYHVPDAYDEPEHRYIYGTQASRVERDR